jgi:cell wall-associated NlpC family hydrolase
LDTLDPRVNAFRPEIADLALKGRVRAARFVPGQELRVRAPESPVRKQPSASARLETEALCGEAVKVFETTSDGWVWVQLVRDSYVGWMPRADLGELGHPPTHRIAALRTFAFAEPDIKSPPLAALPFGAEIAAIGEAEDKNARYALIAPKGAVVMQHLAALDIREPDFTAVAERFLGVPYLWGGKTALGLDCSGLVQIALQSAGTAAPRDTDMQERALGQALPLDAASEEGWPQLRRGDLVFSPGHVGIMRDATTLLHANAHHMAVASEPLDAALARLRKKGDSVTAVKRIG